VISRLKPTYIRNRVCHVCVVYGYVTQFERKHCPVVERKERDDAVEDEGRSVKIPKNSNHTQKCKSIVLRTVNNKKKLSRIGLDTRFHGGPKPFAEVSYQTTALRTAVASCVVVR